MRLIGLGLIGLAALPFAMVAVGWLALTRLVRAVFGRREAF